MPEAERPKLTLFPDKGLTGFEGHQVISAGLEIPGAAGGLRDALDIDPVELRIGQRVFVAFELETEKIRFVRVKDTDALTRVHIMLVRNASFVSEDLVSKELNRQKVRVEEAKGLTRLPGFEDDADATVAIDPGGESGDEGDDQ